MAPVCKFFIKGYCKFGDRCRFEHPGEDPISSTAQDRQSGFSFLSALNNVNQSQQVYTRDTFSFNANRSQGAFAPPASASSFSFTQALQTVQSRPDDVEMSDLKIETGLSFSQVPRPEQIVLPPRPNPQIANNQSNPIQQDYVDIQSLSEEELRCFQSEAFHFRKIPIRPPPKTMC